MHALNVIACRICDYVLASVPLKGRREKIIYTLELQLFAGTNY